MKLLADENIARAIVERLRQDGHDIQHVAEIASGSNDGDVLSLANREGAILLTDDKDFGDWSCCNGEQRTA
jgi:predicted nuclease of predicted toxin-antitoxin system